ncbi:hypothetical protein CENSYa_1085 [Cenarchaeum symbiosum A]|uniref:Uncharacterized protein n=1 Tax=Cenarchaeum symbiosum (strain A) TaxID=414004 RepID=A0RWJ7_CENSY|nr:hypothetical protein CENSYa_1085 [Cenarchaeum symbiosum A]
MASDSKAFRDEIASLIGQNNAGMWLAHASIRSICEFVYDQMGLKISAGAMQHAL